MENACSIESEWPEESLNKNKTARLENMFMLTPEENEMLKVEEAVATNELMINMREHWLLAL
jgi:hypothetical protein